MTTNMSSTEDTTNEENNNSVGVTSVGLEDVTSFSKTKVLLEDNEQNNGLQLLEEKSDFNDVEGEMLEILKEEERLHAETIKEEEKLKQKQEKVLSEVSDDARSQQYIQLEFLLNKSNAYIDFLIKRIERQKEAKSLKKSKKKDTSNINQNQKKAALMSTCRSGKEKDENTPPSPNKKRKADHVPGSMPRRKRRKDELGDEVDDGFNTEIFEDADRVKVLDDGTRLFKGETVHEDQPPLFEGGLLRDYQIEGYCWLKSLYESGVNGILADEMGLGKTVQVIATISHLIEMKVTGPFLVIGPLSTVPNWVNEFKKFSPKVPVILYHGTQEHRQQMKKKMCRLHKVEDGINVHPVVVTSYEIIMRDRKLLQNIEFKYLVIDEGHRVKNAQCRLLKELKMYKTTYRLLLTGTPLQNNLAELWSLLNFLLPEIFDNLGMFESWFNIEDICSDGANEKIVAEERQNNVLSMLHQLLSPFLLRRLKTDVDLVIPPKKEILVFAPLSQKQRELYDMALNRTITQMVENKRVKEPSIEDFSVGRPKRKTRKIDYSIFGDKGEIQKEEDSERDDEDVESWYEKIEKLSNQNQPSTDLSKVPKKSLINIKINNIMMLLRKCTNHPYLIEYPLDNTENFLINEDLVTNCGKMKLLDAMLKRLKRQGHKVLIFSQMTQMLNIIEDYCFLRKYNFCRLDGTMNLEERNEQMCSFNTDPSMFLFLLSTRAGGLGITLTAADTVIIYDSDWNPQVDLQAQDRCHRIGQTVPVVIYRLVTRNTIDQKIVERAAAKRKLEKMVIHKGKFKKGMKSFSKDPIKAMDPKELMALLQSKDHDKEFEEDHALSSSMLDQLLSRDDLYEKWSDSLSPELREKHMKSYMALSTSKKRLTSASNSKDVEPFFKVVDIGLEDDLAHIE